MLWSNSYKSSHDYDHSAHILLLHCFFGLAKASLAGKMNLLTWFFGQNFVQKNPDYKYFASTKYFFKSISSIFNTFFLASSSLWIKACHNNVVVLMIVIISNTIEDILTRIIHAEKISINMFISIPILATILTNLCQFHCGTLTTM